MKTADIDTSFLNWNELAIDGMSPFTGHYYFHAYIDNVNTAKLAYHHIKHWHINEGLEPEVKFTRCEAYTSEYDDLLDAMTKPVQTQDLTKLEVHFSDKQNAALFKLNFL